MIMTEDVRIMKSGASYGKQKKQGRKSGGTFLIILVVAALIGALSFRSYGLYEKGREYEARIEELKQELAAETARTDEVDAYCEYVKTREYKEAVAKERLGLIYPDEILLKPE